MDDFFADAVSIQAPTKNNAKIWLEKFLGFECGKNFPKAVQNDEKTIFHLFLGGRVLIVHPRAPPLVRLSEPAPPQNAGKPFFLDSENLLYFYL